MCNNRMRAGIAFLTDVKHYLVIFQNIEECVQ